MDDAQITDEITHQLTEKVSCIITCEAFSRLHQLSLDAVISAMEKVSSEHANNEAGEERVHKVFCLSGYKHDTQLNTKLRTLLLVHDDERDKLKSQLLSVLSDTLYGVYKGNITDPRRLSVADLEDNDKSCRISPSSDYIPDGNCKRDLSSRAIKPTPNQSKPSTSNTAKETKPACQTSTSSIPSKQQSAKLTAKPKSTSSSSSSTQSKKPAPKSVAKGAQPKLFFGQAKTAPSKPKETNKESSKPAASITSEKTTEKTSQSDESTAVKAETADNESPGKSSDKENKTSADNKAVEQKAKKRSRVQIFSSSDESDAEPEQPSKNNKKGKTKQAKSKTAVVEEKVNVEEPPPIFDDDFESLPVSEDQSKKRRRQRKSADNEAPEENSGDEEGGESQRKKRSKKSVEPNYGRVRAGDISSNVKYVDRTFLDDDGFLVTEKVLEEVQLSEKEKREIEEKRISAAVKQASKVQKPDPVPKVSKKSAATAKPQNNLFSFFKKK